MSGLNPIYVDPWLFLGLLFLSAFALEVLFVRLIHAVNGLFNRRDRKVAAKKLAAAGPKSPLWVPGDPLP